MERQKITVFLTDLRNVVLKSLGVIVIAGIICFIYAKDIIKKGDYDLVILDEINVAVDYKLISLNDVVELLQKKPEALELVLTGRYAPPEIIKHADLVSEILEIKHPYQKGVTSRKGIDW